MRGGFHPGLPGGRYGLLLGIAFSWLCFWGCSEGTEGNLPEKPQIGYRFYSSLDSVGDSTSRMDEVRAGTLALFQRLQEKSVVHGAWSAWPDSLLQGEINFSLLQYPHAQFRLIVDPSRVGNQKALEAGLFNVQPLANMRQVVLENRGNERAGILNPVAEGGRMNVNMLLFQNLKAQGPDNGAFTVLMLGEGWGGNAVTESLCIYGDSSLYERCLSYWEGMRESKTEFTFATSHTYSNLHDHQAWFFPDILAEKPEIAVGILAQLEDGIMETHQPVKIRMVLTGADACHQEFFERLVGLQLEHEADVKVVLKDTSAMALQVARALKKLPDGSLRVFAARDSTHRRELFSRLLLVDGPYVVTEDDPAESRRMCFFFGDDFALENQRENSGMWMRIADQRVFLEAERHWNAIWAMSGEFVEAKRMRMQGRCME